MTCASCNGWGVVFYIPTIPPSKAAERVKVKENKPLLKETVCLSCGGFGTRPGSAYPGKER